MKPQRIQRIAGWVIVAISFVHLAVTFIDYDELSLPSLWFVGSGFALLLIGGLNIVTSSLSPERFGEMKSLRWLTLISDACGISLGILYILLTGGSQPQGPVLVALFGIALGSQLRRQPSY